MGNMKVLLREATIDDLELLLAWRNQPLVYKGFYTQSKINKPISWQEHLTWWHKTKDWKRWIIQVDELELSDNLRDVGQVAVRDLYSWAPDMGIFIGETTLWGQGIGKQALKLAMDWLRQNGYKYCRTDILKSNERAIGLFESVGFKRLTEGRKEEWMYKCQL